MRHYHCHYATPFYAALVSMLIAAATSADAAMLDA